MVTTQSAISTAVDNLLKKQLSDGIQLGVQVCAYKDGERIVDAWTGEMGPEDSRPVQADTLFNSFSTTKGVAATALHVLADRGQIEYGAPVSKYWPEFAANGKEKITVEQAMSHQAGLHAVPNPLTADFICDWQGGIDFIANGTPAWEPGTATGYHALTYGWVVGGIVQGATGRHIKDVVREEIAKPLGVDDQMYIGIPDGLDDRLATLQPAEEDPAMAALLPPEHDFYKAMPKDNDFTFNDLRVRQACMPAANGHFSARALARMYGALAKGGEIDGVRLVSAERISQMNRVVIQQPDLVLLGLPIPKGVGFMMGGNWGAFRAVSGPRGTAFGHSGAGGSTAFADPEVGLAIAVTINKMHNTLQGEGPTFEICELIRSELGVN